jgi:hypothetical protein
MLQPAPLMRAWRTPCGDEQERTFGCVPARFSGQTTTLSNVTMVLWEVHVSANAIPACPSPSGEVCARQACGPSSLAMEEALAKYQGKAVMLMRGGCSFEQKWLTLKDVGAAAMIVVQNTVGAFPIEMVIGPGDNERYDHVHFSQTNIPACMTFSDQWERFAGRASVHVSFNHVQKYRFEDESVPRNDITGQPPCLILLWHRPLCSAFVVA